MASSLGGLGLRALESLHIFHPESGKQCVPSTGSPLLAPQSVHTFTWEESLIRLMLQFGVTSILCKWGKPYCQPQTP